ncbi:MAG: ABC transporter permease subunit [Ignavibacteria bacterium]|nr:ABC transporter permease subunit [Ignavibacteria bacterium]
MKAGKQAVTPGKKSQSLLSRRWQKFKSLKRGYYSFVILVIIYLLSFLLPVLVSNKALVVQYNGSKMFPAFADLVGLASYHGYEDFGLKSAGGEVNYRRLSQEFEKADNGNYVIMPLYPFSPQEDISVEGNEKFLPPLTPGTHTAARLLGTDDRGRDVFARMAYGLNVSLSFALLLAILEYCIGVPIGAISGYFGGKFDLILQRVVEIWFTLPVLFIIIIVVSLVSPNFFLLLGLLLLVSWISIALYIRAEFLRERTRDYVAAAVSIGVPTWKIIVRHILPNSLVPIITFFPFSIVSGITALVSLDYLGFGLPPGTPSWGEMFGLGVQYINQNKWWLVMSPMSAMFFTLSLTVFVGEAVREAFDPKTFSRLR